MFLKHEHLWLPVTCKARPWRPTNASPVIVWNNLVWNPWRERFEDIGDASYDEIFASLGVNQLIGFGAGGSSPLTPVTRDYDSGSGTETSPTGDGTVVVSSAGGGGGGGCRLTNGGGGGGGGGYCLDSARTVTTGATCSYSVGAAGNGDTNNTASGNGTDGGASTVNTGAGGFSGIAQSAGGGVASIGFSGGTGGSASGGTSTNTSGNNGTDGPDGPGGDAGTFIGSGSRGKGGTGGNTGGSVGTAGTAGRIRFAYTA